MQFPHKSLVLHCVIFRSHLHLVISCFWSIRIGFIYFKLRYKSTQDTFQTDIKLIVQTCLGGGLTGVVGINVSIFLSHICQPNSFPVLWLPFHCFDHGKRAPGLLNRDISFPSVYLFTRLEISSLYYCSVELVSLN